MISVDPSKALILYLMFFFITLLFLWLKSNKKRTKAIKVKPFSVLYLCYYCTFVYLDKNHKKITQCPQCKSFNKDNCYKANKENTNKKFF